MDLLANDLTAILVLLAAILSVVTGVLPFFKKPENMPCGNIFKKT